MVNNAESAHGTSPSMESNPQIGAAKLHDEAAAIIILIMVSKNCQAEQKTSN